MTTKGRDSTSEAAPSYPKHEEAYSGSVQDKQCLMKKSNIIWLVIMQAVTNWQLLAAWCCRYHAITAPGISTEFVQPQAEPRAECREFIREVQGHCEESGEVIYGREGSQ